MRHGFRSIVRELPRVRAVVWCDHLHDGIDWRMSRHPHTLLRDDGTLPPAGVR